MSQVVPKVFRNRSFVVCGDVSFTEDVRNSLEEMGGHVHATLVSSYVHVDFLVTSRVYFEQHCEESAEFNEALARDIPIVDFAWIRVCMDDGLFSSPQRTFRLDLDFHDRSAFRPRVQPRGQVGPAPTPLRPAEPRANISVPRFSPETAPQRPAGMPTPPQTLGAAMYVSPPVFPSEPASDTEEVDQDWVNVQSAEAATGSGESDEEDDVIFYDDVNLDTLHRDYCQVLQCCELDADHFPCKNKYYAVELHRARRSCAAGATKDECVILTHYGRTDDLARNPDSGRHEIRHFGSFKEAIRAYNALLAQKLSVKGYKVVHLIACNVGTKQLQQYIDAVHHETRKAPVSRKAPQTPPPAVLKLVDELYNEALAALSAQVLAKITPRGVETPIGALSTEQVESAQVTLDQIERTMSGKFGPVDQNVLRELSAHFYSLVPHFLGGRSRAAGVTASTINSPELLEAKRELMQLTSDLIQASECIAEELTTMPAVEQQQALKMTFLRFLALRCDIKKLEESDPVYQMLKMMIGNTSDRAPCTIVRIFEIQRHDERERCEKLREKGSAQLLFHGSRPSNWYGILSRGLLLPRRLATYGVKRTNFGLLGPGLYFSDRFDTITRYSNTGISGVSHRFASVACVDVGRMLEVSAADPTLSAPPQGYESVKGIAGTSDFQDNEIVVYECSRQCLRYLVEYVCPQPLPPPHLGPGVPQPAPPPTAEQPQGFFGAPVTRDEMNQKMAEIMGAIGGLKAMIQSQSPATTPSTAASAAHPSALPFDAPPQPMPFAPFGVAPHQPAAGWSLGFGAPPQGTGTGAIPRPPVTFDFSALPKNPAAPFQYGAGGPQGTGTGATPPQPAPFGFGGPPQGTGAGAMPVQPVTCWVGATQMPAAPGFQFGTGAPRAATTAKAPVQLKINPVIPAGFSQPAPFQQSTPFTSAPRGPKSAQKPARLAKAAKKKAVSSSSEEDSDDEKMAPVKKVSPKPAMKAAPSKGKGIRMFGAPVFEGQTPEPPAGTHVDPTAMQAALALPVSTTAAVPTAMPILQRTVPVPVKAARKTAKKPVRLLAQKKAASSSSSEESEDEKMAPAKKVPAARKAPIKTLVKKAPLPAPKAHPVHVDVTMPMKTAKKVAKLKPKPIKKALPVPMPSAAVIPSPPPAAVTDVWDGFPPLMELAYDHRNACVNTVWVDDVHGRPDGSCTSGIRTYPVPVNSDQENTLIMETDKRLRELFASRRFDSELQDPFVGCLDAYSAEHYRSFMRSGLTETELRIPRVLDQWTKPISDLNFRSSIVDSQTFKKKFDAFTQGQLNGMNWNNVFIAGGCILACLMHDDETSNGFRGSDVDMFLYGLTDEEAEQKIKHIFEIVSANRVSQGKTEGALIRGSMPDIVRTAHAVTIVGGYPFRHIQIVLRMYLNPAEVILGFDIDSCSVGYNGQRVFVTPRARRALNKRINMVDMTRRSLNYEERLLKYSKRGFAVAVPNLKLNRVDPAVYTKGVKSQHGLGRLLAYDELERRNVGELEGKKSHHPRTPPNVRLSPLKKNRTRKEKHRKARMSREERREKKRSNRKERIEQQGLVSSGRAGRPRRADWHRARPDDFDDYDVYVMLPWGPAWHNWNLRALLVRMDKAQLFNTHEHHHVAVDGIENIFTGKAAWCKLCQKEVPTTNPPDEIHEKYVAGKLKFLRVNPGRQLMTAAFHPIDDDKYDAEVYLADGDPDATPPLHVRVFGPPLAPVVAGIHITAAAPALAFGALPQLISRPATMAQPQDSAPTGAAQRGKAPRGLTGPKGLAPAARPIITLRQGPGVCVFHTPDFNGDADDIYAFALEGTLVSRQMTVPKKRTDWSWNQPGIAEKLEELGPQCGGIVIFSNARCISEGEVATMINTEQTFCESLSEFLSVSLTIPFCVLVSFRQDRYHLPATGMWALFLQCVRKAGKPRRVVMCGADAGRLSDSSSDDRDFAQNIGAEFMVVEELLGTAKTSLPAPTPFSLAGFVTSERPPDIFHRASLEVVVLVGGPSSGKTTFAQRHLQPHGYFITGPQSEQMTSAPSIRLVETVFDALRHGTSVVVDACNANPENRCAFVQLAKRFTAGIRCFEMETPVEAAKKLFLMKNYCDTGDPMGRAVQGRFSEFENRNSQYMLRYQRPSESEGFNTVIRIPFVAFFENAYLRSLFLQR